MKTLIRAWLTDLFYCLYPKICPVCKSPIRIWNRWICYHCHEKLAYTHSWKLKKHPMEAFFWGRLKVERMDAQFHYRKNSPIQTILHRIKYHHYPELAQEIGRNYGKFLKSSGNYSQISAIVPIPLHPEKLRKRGYNQAEKWAQGLAESMNLPVETRLLKKTTKTSTQTKKNREKRSQELANSFEVVSYCNKKNPHFLLVDDVITTGATLEAAGKKLLEIPGSKISIVSLAIVN